MILKLLLDLSALVNIMSLTELIYLQIDTSELEGNHIMLKYFTGYCEKALGSNIFTFEVDGWAFKIKL